MKKGEFDHNVGQFAMGDKWEILEREAVQQVNCRRKIREKMHEEWIKEWYTFKLSAIGDINSYH